MGAQRDKGVEAWYIDAKTDMLKFWRWIAPVLAPRVRIIVLIAIYATFTKRSFCGLFGSATDFGFSVGFLVSQSVYKSKSIK